MRREEKLVVHILCGFLGSGKTTLLQHWLRSQDGSDVAVLVNEFGEVGIDHFLLQAIAPDTVLLPGGCVCCQIRGELKQALLDLYEGRERGELPPFRHVVIETTGLADPAPILSTLLHDRQLQYHFAQGAVITLVDAEHAWDQAEHQPEWLAQVTAADTLLLSKCDRVDGAALAPLKDYLARLNPMAQIDESARALQHPDRLFVARMTSGEDASAIKHQVFRWLGNAASAALIAAPAAALKASHPQTHTCVITLENDINWSAFAVWLSLLLHCHGKSVLRMKGILRVNESASPIVIHGVQHSLHPPEHMAAWPGKLRESQLVFIMRGIDPATLRQAFLRFQQPFISEKAPT
ncbi:MULTISPECIES: CobW family GTP-binding protein [unclassified Brenneria]|uniref:CobW family GTP-binding protein n=1 Tax=unclassified Brenneria TaxID=2634434 RepID=UPI0015517433|nr:MULTISPECIES: GTP-binding protein [unclassified Brenneria]MBJ7222628.1 GTP-binding protein [Brenneria sp. L3-3C-1]MEE3643871.1 GTP-binding protein [Brenneria sp. L3_3C_1]MEE3651176.1 GTP-binding protein [Brenneria sp. HEZEL_4_2_4]NPD01131.1 GTP-binding protein [Brenneria sp. hezel4-2-4]